VITGDAVSADSLNQALESVRLPEQRGAVLPNGWAMHVGGIMALSFRYRRQRLGGRLVRDIRLMADALCTMTPCAMHADQVDRR
jgi:hypothetical protein